ALREALARPAGEDATPTALLDVPPERQIVFRAVGLGHVMLDALCEAMSHENLLAHADLWQDVSQAVASLLGPDPDDFRKHLQAAADRLQAARDVLYPVTVYAVDLCLLEDAFDLPW